MMTLKLEETLRSAGIDTRTLAGLEWPGLYPRCYSLQSDGTKAVGFWERLRTLTDHTGFWPLIAGEEEHLLALRDNYEMEISADHEVGGSGGSADPTSALITSGESLDLRKWFERRMAESEAQRRCDQGAWPSDLPSRGKGTLALTHRYDYTAGTEKPYPRVFLLFLPVTVAWQVPAFLRLGGWNKCPQTETHIAVAKSWCQRYGAEIISASNNIIEMRVNNPPKTRDDSLNVAREQFIYCNDLIHLKFKTLSALAATLIDAPYWSFWWS